MMRMAQLELGVRTRDTVMVGDTMDTDILGGLGMGYRTVLVLSGHTRQSDLCNFAYRPDYVVESVDHMPEELLWTHLAVDGAA